MVPEVVRRFVMVPVVETKLEIVPTVAKRLVVVTAVAVTEANSAFHRSEADPSESVASKVGMRDVEIPPNTAKAVVVTEVPVAFVKVRPWREVEPETVRLLFALMAPFAVRVLETVTVS